MLDQLLRVLGYVPASSVPPMQFINDEPSPGLAPVEPPCPAHRRIASTFDFSAADRDDLCFWYHEGEETHSYAVGKDDWVPLTVAGFSLSPNSACRKILDDGIRSRLWLNVRDEIVSSWREANFDLLFSFGIRLDREFRPTRAPADSGELELDVIPFVEPVEMAALVAMTWQQAHVTSPMFFLGNSQAYASLASHYAVRSAGTAANHALERVMQWLAVWLESRGVVVDHALGLVHLPGYQALFYRADQGL